MRILNILCLATVIAASALAAGPAAAAGRDVRPLAPAECTRLANTISTILNGVQLPLSGTAAPTVIWEDLLVSGVGCRFTGSTPVAKLQPEFPYAPTAEDTPLQDWQDVPQVAADGPDGGIGGFSKGGDVVLFAWNVAVPEEVCRNAKDIETCEEENAEKAVYHFEAIAFSFADGGPIGNSDFKQYE